MNLLNQPLSWDPKLYGFMNLLNQPQCMSRKVFFLVVQAFGSAQAFGSPLHEPDVIPETQHEVAETQKGKGKRPHKKKADTTTRAKKNVISWESDEEYALTRAWIDVSEDPVIANNQSKSVFWARIRDLFFDLMGK
ncbi:hypothetical protein HanIR_Chr16g0823611 [Helianthus annuus]|nr:hypothetical protein HanIR_Chr16g0823611 [Helianthus annuus]KAJ0461147.1 hypothetical protein HanHA89_Chr16g0669041 [Helianthus annuus]